QQYRRVEHLLAHHLGLRCYPGMGAYAQIAEPLASWPVPPRIREPGRAGDLADHGRLDLRNSAWARASRSRSAKHVELRLQHEFAVAQLRLDKCLLRLGFHERGVRDAI